MISVMFIILSFNVSQNPDFLVAYLTIKFKANYKIMTFLCTKNWTARIIS